MKGFFGEIEKTPWKMEIFAKYSILLGIDRFCDKSKIEV